MMMTHGQVEGFFAWLFLMQNMHVQEDYWKISEMIESQWPWSMSTSLHKKTLTPKHTVFFD